MMGTNFRHGRRAAIIAAAAFLVMLIIPLTLVVVYYQTAEKLNTQIITQQQTLADLAALALKVRLDSLVGIASSLATSTQLESYAAGGQWNNAIDVARDLQNNINYYDPFIDRIIIYDTNGTQEAAYPALVGGLGTNASSSPWYKSLSMGGSSFYVSNVTKRLSFPQIQVVNIAVPISSSGTTVGFLVLQIPTDNFLEFTGNLSLGTYGFGYIVDSQGNLVAHPKYFSDMSGVIDYSFVPQVQKVVMGESGTDIISDKTDGEKSIITYKPVEEYGWGVVTQELYSEAFSTRTSILFGLELLIIAAALIDVLISYIIFRVLFSRHE